MRKNVKFTLATAAVVVGGLLYMTQPALGDVHLADSCNDGDVQAAINLAQSHNSDNETVTIPAGSCSWDDQVIVDATGIANYTIQGAGQAATFITGTRASSSSASSAELYITNVTSSTELMRVTGFTYTGTGTDTGADAGDFHISGTAGSEDPNIRIDHITVTDVTHAWIKTSGCPYGVIDHVDFTSNDDGETLLTLFHSSCGGGANGDGSWAAPVVPGSLNAMYVEDTQIRRPFTGTTAYYSFDQFEGSRLVIRKSKFWEATLSSHGWAEGGRRRGMLWLEVYDVDIDCNADNMGDPSMIDSNFNWRGGSGIAVDIDVVDCSTSLAWNLFIAFNEHRSSEPPGSNSDNPTLGGLCDGDAPYDGNTNNAGDDGYPCVDQHGRSTGDLLSGSTPTPVGWPNQISRPIYVADISVPVTPTFGVVNGDAYVRHTRDYYFDGSGGVGVGAVASRPSTCDAHSLGGSYGEGWYDPNTNTISTCNTNGTSWSTYWQPATYPHPLTLIGESGEQETTRPARGRGARRL